MNKENRTLNIGWKDLNAGQDEKEISFLLEQIQVLKNKNEQLLTELNELKEENIKVEVERDEYLSVIQDLQHERNVVESKLNELKENHKKDVIKTYIHCKEQKYGNYDLRQITFDAEQYYEQYYKQKFESNE